MLAVGQRIDATRVFSQEDFDRFARLSGDDNPIHVDPVFAAATRFGRTLCHGMLLMSTLSGVIRRALAALDLVIEDIELTFPGPTYVDDKMQIAVEVESVDGDRAKLAVVITAPDGVAACLSKVGVRARRA